MRARAREQASARGKHVRSSRRGAARPDVGFVITETPTCSSVLTLSPLTLSLSIYTRVKMHECARARSRLVNGAPSLTSARHEEHGCGAACRIGRRADLLGACGCAAWPLALPPRAAPRGSGAWAPAGRAYTAILYTAYFTLCHTQTGLRTAETKHVRRRL